MSDTGEDLACEIVRFAFVTPMAIVAVSSASEVLGPRQVRVRKHQYFFDLLPGIVRILADPAPRFILGGGCQPMKTSGGNVGEGPRSAGAGGVGPVAHPNVGPEAPAEGGEGPSDPITSHAFPSLCGAGNA